MNYFFIMLYVLLYCYIVKFNFSLKLCVPHISKRREENQEKTKKTNRSTCNIWDTIKPYKCYNYYIWNLLLLSVVLRNTDCF